MLLLVSMDRGADLFYDATGTFFREFFFRVGGAPRVGIARSWEVGICRCVPVCPILVS